MTLAGFIGEVLSWLAGILLCVKNPLPWLEHLCYHNPVEIYRQHCYALLLPRVLAFVPLLKLGCFCTLTIEIGSFEYFTAVLDLFSEPATHDCF